MIYVLAALLPPLGLLLNGQPFSAIFNLVLIVFCLVFGLIFHVLLLVPSAHALIVVHMKREDRRHREVVEECRIAFLGEIEARHITNVDLFEVPGSFEIPLHAQILAKTRRYTAIVAAGP